MDGETRDGRWLTYAELAELRGISKASATRMSFRHKWRRQDGNDGTARVFVPASALRDKAHGTAMESMTAAIQAAMGLAEAERARADRAEAAIAGERSRADQAWTLAHQWAADLAAARTDADQARAQAQDAAQAADDLRQADADRRARGRLARLRAAWRGD